MHLGLFMRVLEGFEKKSGLTSSQYLVQVTCTAGITWWFVYQIQTWNWILALEVFKFKEFQCLANFLQFWVDSTKIYNVYKGLQLSFTRGNTYKVGNKEKEKRKRSCEIMSTKYMSTVECSKMALSCRYFTAIQWNSWVQLFHYYIMTQ